MHYSRIHIISTDGAEHATGYVNGNKIITLWGKTHLFWSDHYSYARARTFDHVSGSWSDAVTLGEGLDDHCNPSVTADRHGVLRVAYGPHGMCERGEGAWNWPSGRFIYAVAKEANSLCGLDAPLSRYNSVHCFGYAGTYATLLHTTWETDCIIYRGGESPHGVFFQQRRAQGGWTQAKQLFTMDIPPCYTKFNETMVCGQDGTLYAAANFFAIPPQASEGIAVLRSNDQGQTWTGLNGEPACLPVRCEAPFAIPNSHAGISQYLHGMALDADGHLWLMTAAAEANDWPRDLSRRIGGILLRWDGSAWTSIDVARFLPDDRWFPVDCPITFDTHGRLHILMAASDRTRYRADAGESLWSHPSSEIFYLMSTDGGKTFTCRMLSDGNPKVANWLPSISQSGPFHPVDSPVFLFTNGNLETRGRNVCCIFAEE